jgi:hypothetical protein
MANANAAVASKAKPDPKKDAKKPAPGKGGASVLEDPNVPKDITITYDTSDLKGENDFMVLDRSYTHMRHPLPKRKTDPNMEKRAARA